MQRFMIGQFIMRNIQSASVLAAGHQHYLLETLQLVGGTRPGGIPVCGRQNRTYINP